MAAAHTKILVVSVAKIIDMRLTPVLPMHALCRKGWQPNCKASSVINMAPLRLTTVSLLDVAATWWFAFPFCPRGVRPLLFTTVAMVLRALSARLYAVLFTCAVPLYYVKYDAVATLSSQL